MQKFKMLGNDWPRLRNKPDLSGYNRLSHTNAFYLGERLGQRKGTEELACTVPVFFLCALRRARTVSLWGPIPEMSWAVSFLATSLSKKLNNISLILFRCIFFSNVMLYKYIYNIKTNCSLDN